MVAKLQKQDPKHNTQELPLNGIIAHLWDVIM